MRGSRYPGGINKQEQFQFTPLHERQHIAWKRLWIQKHIFQFTPLHERQHYRAAMDRESAPYFNSRLYMRGSWIANVRRRKRNLFQFTPLHERQLQKYTIFSIKSTQFSTKPCFFIVTSRKVVLFSIPVQYFL